MKQGIRRQRRVR